VRCREDLADREGLATKRGGVIVCQAMAPAGLHGPEMHFQKEKALDKSDTGHLRSSALQVPGTCWW
jgi:hypothetical protein